MYDIDVFPVLISKVTDAVIDQVVGWQNRPLDAVYPIVYLDCTVLKARLYGRAINKSVFLALSINIEDQKELLDMWLVENEGAEFQLNVLTELKSRGLNDILIACVDDLKSFPEAINTAYPETQLQSRIVYTVRNNLRLVTWKDYEAMTRDLKQVYHVAAEEGALQAPDTFEGEWDARYPQVSRNWRVNVSGLSEPY